MICHMIQTAKQKSPTQIPKQPKTPMELRSQSLIMRPWLRYRARHHSTVPFTNTATIVGFSSSRVTDSPASPIAMPDERLSRSDAQERFEAIPKAFFPWTWIAGRPMPSAVQHVLSLLGGSRMRRFCRFLPPVTGDPEQHHPVNRIVGAFSSIRALPRILRIELGQRHRRYSLSKAANTRFLYALS